jgi:hypothetical protein
MKGEEKTQELSAKYQDVGIDELQKITSDGVYQWEGEDYSTKVVHFNCLFLRSCLETSSFVEKSR